MALPLDISAINGTASGKKAVARYSLPTGKSVVAGATLTGGTVSGTTTFAGGETELYVGLPEIGSSGAYGTTASISALPDTTDRPVLVEIREVDDGTVMTSYAAIAAAFEAATEVLANRQVACGAMKGGWVINGAWSIDAALKTAVTGIVVKQVTPQIKEISRG